jgi:hypothetical protein
VSKPGGALLLVHYPRPVLHALPLRDEVKARLGPRGRGSPARALLVTPKIWAERQRVTRCGSPDELCSMLGSCGYPVLTVDPGPPIVIVAERA